MLWVRFPSFLKKAKLITQLVEYAFDKCKVNGSSPFKLKNMLLRDGVFQPVCSSCNSAEWLGKPIPLELEHIDGNCRNNTLENLTLLCPNCHAFTSTYRGKNIGNKW